ncbi:uncharacterized protein YecT (DUF1311 family) [Cytobacillus eiseniae]|uniref:Uncharacterized protein YecT (DUF1311 family) n=1 Tax=Cytobacillus eiseniae TaxID=762947 RepID=A0ABS4RGY7_9BACI|nr:lysozyme inhibitor LprI family protein [Cytobacillus eiseniae]MBP2242151.1 uncharacterized protein YecT (DUF1311 family) [Cytobacillus eiseniae]
MKKILGLVLFSLFLTGCSNEVDSQPMDDVMVSLEEGNFDKALLSLEETIEEAPNNEEAVLLHEQIQAFNQVKTAVDDGELDEALNRSHELLKDENLNESIQAAVEQIIKDVEIEIADGIKEHHAYNEGLAKEREEKEKAEGSKSTEKIQKDEFIKKLDAIEKSLAEFDPIFKNGTQIEMTEAQGEIYKRWDAILNEIYGELEKQLATSEMENLRIEQREWVASRDVKAKEAAAKYEGGSLASLEYVMTQTRLTKERCYELVETYL